MFSTTTIASSITRPIAAATPPKVMRSKDRPTTYMARNVARTVTGMTRMATNVVPQLRRKAQRMATESRRPIRIASRTEVMEALTSSDWS